ncbi:MAG: DegV family protein [Clostridium sp.]|nr:DegV family protein [Clostridium sp.]MBO6150270.1 DegV family protein [Clostridium sp.]
MSIRIIIDSTTDVSPEAQQQMEVVPLTVSFGEEEYLDGVDLTREDFYRKLEAGQILPKTSQPSPEAFARVYDRIRQEGNEGILITVSSALSGTYQSACIAAEEYPEIRVIDGKNVAIGTGILAEYALRRTEEGAELDALAEELEKKREEICLVAMLDTLEYLKRGGRISKTAALAGGILNIKPVITLKDGVIVILGKARGAKKANNLLVEQIEQNGIDYSLPILLGYTGTSDTLLQNYIHDSRALWEGHVEKLEYALICSVVGTHAGPGAVAVAFFRTKQID